MGYGDLQFIDLIVFAGVAGFLIYRLRNVLGKRSGFEKKNKKEKDTLDINKKPQTAPQLKDSEKKLTLAYETLENFDHKNFLEGAKFAFETIINAFNKKDKKTLKTLLTKDVFLSFEKTIDKDGVDPDFEFFSLLVDGVENVVVENDLISITLKITSEQFKNNDENTILKKQDVWTFQKKINNSSPVWLLSST